MTNPEEENALERYRLIITIVGEYANEKKGMYIKLISDLVSYCAEYVRIIIEVEAFTQFGRHALETKVYQKEMIEYDKRRKIAHEALLSQLYIVNRALLKEELLKGKVPIGGIYSLNPDTIRDRNSVSDWAGYLVKALARRGFVKLKR
ncbi:MAG TPA: DUF3232 domain-containing protein [Candidatus Nanoarchaeia archaeon]|nr:DUF3232 domain-containing protein [Candidatus Nanoarchaeia archaeon]